MRDVRGQQGGLRLEAELLRVGEGICLKDPAVDDPAVLLSRLFCV